MKEAERIATGDTHSLGLADGEFDAAVAHTLFSHVDDPAAVLAEIKRVVRPGGRIAVFDGDYASLTFEEEDEARSKAESEKHVEALATQPRVQRQRPRLAKRCGLAMEPVLPYVLTEAGKADFRLSAVEGFRTLGPRSGVVDAATANAWADRQLRASEEGVFFASSNYYGYVFRNG